MSLIACHLSISLLLIIYLLFQLDELFSETIGRKNNTILRYGYEINIRFDISCLAALFLIEKFADYSEDAGFTQLVVSYLIRAIRFGLPPRAVSPFVLGVYRLVWLGHLVPAQLHKIVQAGSELVASKNIYFAQSGNNYNWNRLSCLFRI